MRGTFAEFTLAQLLQLFALSDRSGTIAAESGNRRTQIHVESNRIVGIGGAELDLVAALSACELLPAESRAAVSALPVRDDVPGLGLVVSNLIEPRRWEAFVERHLEQELYPLLSVAEGSFEVTVGRTPSPAIQLFVPVQQAILDGSRWESELEDLRAGGYALTNCWRRAPTNSHRPDSGLTLPEWLIWSLLADPSNVQEAARRLCIPDLVASTAVRRLESVGLVLRMAE